MIGSPFDRLLKQACQLYSEVLHSPLDRMRAFITLHRPGQFAVGGALFSNGHPQNRPVANLT